MKFGEALRAERQRAGVSARELAERCAEIGLPLGRQRIANIESERGTDLAVMEWLTIARALDVAPIALLVGLGDDGTRADEDEVTLADGWRVTVGALREWLGTKQPGARVAPFVYGTVLQHLLPAVPVEARERFVEALAPALKKAGL